MTLANVAVTFTWGPSIDKLVLSGWLALDNKTMVLSIPEPAVEQQTYSTGVVRKRISQRALNICPSTFYMEQSEG